MITAGMDTTAISVEWAIAELVRSPDIQAKAQQELDQVRLVSSCTYIGTMRFVFMVCKFECKCKEWVCLIE